MTGWSRTGFWNPVRRWPGPPRAGLLSLLALLAFSACATAPAADLAPELGIDTSTMTRTESGVLYRDVRVGTGLAAVPGDTVVIHYTGWLADGTRFEASRERGEPLVAGIGPGSRLVRGWNEGIQGMRAGGRRTLVIPPSLAYGSRGAEGVIPPNATLVFDVELLEIR